MLTKSKPEDAARLIIEAQEDVKFRWHLYERMAKHVYGGQDGHDHPEGSRS